MNRLIALVLILAGSAGLGGASSTADVVLDFTFSWDKAAIEVPSETQRTQAGQFVKITRITGLISEVAFVRADGTSVQIPGQFGLFDAESGRSEVRLSDVPVGDYVGMQMRLGVPPKTNHADPGQWPSDHPLNPLVNGLHWGWTGGYVFLAVEGRFGATTTNLDQGFSFHLATDELDMPVRFHRDFSIDESGRIALMFDVSDWLEDLTLDSATGTTSTHSRDGDPLARTLADHVGTAFWFGGMMPDASLAPTSVAAIAETSAVVFEIPAGWPQPELPADNLPTQAGIALGQQLFHDPRLSGNGSQSCVECHQPEAGFADDLRFSIGINGDLGTRNSMPLVNLAWNPDFAWDGSQPRIRDQAITAMTNPIEMDGDPVEIVAALEADPYVRTAFSAAFGDEEISIDRIGKALEQFLLTLVSADSKFDQAMRGEAELTELETRGMELFNSEFDPRQRQFGADCFHCHGGALFSNFAAKNNGLDLVSDDAGRANVSGQETDHGKFKTPSLRNVALTAPYMHDGRFETLEEVVAHYVSGVARPAQLDPNLAKHPGPGVPISRYDQRALVAFLKTLTDPTLAPSPDPEPTLAHHPTS